MSIQELWLKRDEKKIYGKLYLPVTGKQTFPLIIMSHGFTATHTKNEIYAQMAYEQGFAVYVFDFCGGSIHSQSDGDFTEMSVLTEAADLEAIIEQLSDRSDIDSRQIYLQGESQGAFVSAYVAAEIPEKIAGLILFYPAFVLQDDAAERVEKYGSGPKVDDVMGVTIGRIYTIDALSFDIYDVIGAYKKPVLLVHGDCDPIVPLCYSQKALEVYEKAELIVIPEAGHSFYGEDAKRAGEALLDYIGKL